MHLPVSRVHLPYISPVSRRRARAGRCHLVRPPRLRHHGAHGHGAPLALALVLALTIRLTLTIILTLIITLTLTLTLTLAQVPKGMELPLHVELTKY